MFIEFINENIWAVLAFAITFNLLLMSIMQGQVKGVGQVSPLEMPSLQRSGKSTIIDVNSEAHFATQHIPNAINVPLEKIDANNKALMKHKNNTVIVACQSGGRSAKAARKLRELGFDNVHILRGGLMAWNKENLPTTTS